MHYMSLSAITTKRAERKAATASRLTSASRRLTTEVGLNGFTIEELCNEVEVSRRTFFNYFASKEEAVIGIDESADAARFTAQFLERESRGWPAVIDDFISLTVEHVRESEFSVGEHAEFIAALTREPKLLARFINISRDREHHMAELISQREQVDIDDIRTVAAVTFLATVVRLASERILDPRFTSDLAQAITESYDALRAVTR